MWNGWGMGGFAVFWIVLVALVIIIVVLVARVAGRDGHGDDGARRGTTGADSARNELDRRYARGELERDEYLQIREDLDRR